MRLNVEHTTRFEYSEPVCESATEVRLQPVDDGWSGQRCFSFRLAVLPATSIFGYTDYYGNNVHHFTVPPNHGALQITALSVVETGSGALSGDGDPLRQYDFLHESRYVHFDPAVQDFAAQFRGAASAFALAEAVCRRINEVLIYERGVTGVHSTS